jgi:hypothetical protein
MLVVKPSGEVMMNIEFCDEVTFSNALPISPGHLVRSYRKIGIGGESVDKVR